MEVDRFWGWYVGGGYRREEYVVCDSMARVWGEGVGWVWMVWASVLLVMMRMRRVGLKS